MKNIELNKKEKETSDPFSKFLKPKTIVNDPYSKFLAPLTKDPYSKFLAPLTNDPYSKFLAPLTTDPYSKFLAPLTTDPYSKFLPPLTRADKPSTINTPTVDVKNTPIVDDVVFTLLSDKLTKREKINKIKNDLYAKAETKSILGWLYNGFTHLLYSVSYKAFVAGAFVAGYSYLNGISLGTFLNYLVESGVQSIPNLPGYLLEGVSASGALNAVGGIAVSGLLALLKKTSTGKKLLAKKVPLGYLENILQKVGINPKTITLEKVGSKILGQIVGGTIAYLSGTSLDHYLIMASLGLVSEPILGALLKSPEYANRGLSYIGRYISGKFYTPEEEVDKVIEDLVDSADHVKQKAYESLFNPRDKENIGKKTIDEIEKTEPQYIKDYVESLNISEKEDRKLLRESKEEEKNPTEESPFPEENFIKRRKIKDELSEYIKDFKLNADDYTNKKNHISRDVLTNIKVFESSVNPKSSDMIIRKKKKRTLDIVEEKKILPESIDIEKQKIIFEAHHSKILLSMENSKNVDFFNLEKIKLERVRQILSDLESIQDIDSKLKNLKEDIQISERKISKLEKVQKEEPTEFLEDIHKKKFKSIYYEKLYKETIKKEKIAPKKNTESFSDISAFLKKNKFLLGAAAVAAGLTTIAISGGNVKVLAEIAKESALKFNELDYVKNASDFISSSDMAKNFISKQILSFFGVSGIIEKFSGFLSPGTIKELQSLNEAIKHEKNQTIIRSYYNRIFGILTGGDYYPAETIKKLNRKELEQIFLQHHPEHNPEKLSIEELRNSIINAQSKRMSIIRGMVNTFLSTTISGTIAYASQKTFTKIHEGITSQIKAEEQIQESNLLEHNAKIQEQFKIEELARLKKLEKIREQEQIKRSQLLENAKDIAQNKAIKKMKIQKLVEQIKLKKLQNLAKEQLPTIHVTPEGAAFTEEINFYELNSDFIGPSRYDISGPEIKPVGYAPPELRPTTARFEFDLPTSDVSSAPKQFYEMESDFIGPSSIPIQGPVFKAPSLKIPKSNILLNPTPPSTLSIDVNSPNINIPDTTSFPDVSMDIDPEIINYLTDTIGDVEFESLLKKSLRGTVSMGLSEITEALTGLPVSSITKGIEVANIGLYTTEYAWHIYKIANVLKSMENGIKPELNANPYIDKLLSLRIPTVSALTESITEYLYKGSDKVKLLDVTIQALKDKIKNGWSQKRFLQELESNIMLGEGIDPSILEFSGGGEILGVLKLMGVDL